MTISHPDRPEQQPDLQQEKVARMACCCKLSDLLPLVRQQLQARREQQEQQAVDQQRAA